MNAQAGCVTFVAMQLAKRVSVRVDTRIGGNLLDLAMQHDIPLPCDCRQGHCGRCAVKIAPLQSPTQMRKLSLRERYLLLSAGKITRREYDNEYLPDRPALWRLACEYRMTDEQIMVAF